MKSGLWIAALTAVLLLLGAVALKTKQPRFLFAPAVVAITKSELQVDGMRITLAATGQSVTIDPLPVRHAECDGVLTRGRPGWRGDFLLPKTAWVYRGLRPGTLTVSVAGDPARRLARGRDYLVDTDWGSLNAAAKARFRPGTKLHFAYDYTSSRLDLVEAGPDGTLRVKKGREDMHEPRLPAPTRGSTPLFSVYLPHNTTALTLENLQIIDPTYRGIPPVSGTEALAPVLRKLAGKEPVTIVFFGDSITAQPSTDMRDGKGSFVDRFAAYLRRRYPQRRVTESPSTSRARPGPGQIVISKAGVGGDTTREGLKRIRQDVLSHRPDLVVVMFGTNDENRKPGSRSNVVPVREYRRNIDEIVKLVRASGGEPLLMTTGMKNPGWISTTGNLGDYAAALRDEAKARRTCLVDNYQAWQNLPRRGYPPMVFLDSCINHPNGLGHELFFQGLRAAFEAK